MDGSWHRHGMYSRVLVPASVEIVGRTFVSSLDP